MGETTKAALTATAGVNTVTEHLERTAAGARGERRRRAPTHRHPLVHTFPLTVLALATFLVVFAMLMARQRGGGLGPAPSTSRAISAAGLPQPKIVTRSSGASTPSSAAGTAIMPAGASQSRPAPVVTRASGLSEGGEDGGA